MASAKMANSIARRTIPGTTTGAVPERLGSLGTANVPHIAATITGIPKAKINRIQPSLCFQPQIPVAVNAVNSRRNRTAKLTGCDPMGFQFLSRLNSE